MGVVKIYTDILECFMETSVPNEAIKGYVNFKPMPRLDINDYVSAISLRYIAYRADGGIDTSGQCYKTIDNLIKKEMMKYRYSVYVINDVSMDYIDFMCERSSQEKVMETLLNAYKKRYSNVRFQLVNEIKLIDYINLVVKGSKGGITGTKNIGDTKMFFKK